MRYSRYFFIIFAAKTKLSCYLNIVTYFNIAKYLDIKVYLNITGGSFENVKLKKDEDLKKQKTRYKEVLNNTFFLTAKSCLAMLVKV